MVSIYMSERFTQKLAYLSIICKQQSQLPKIGLGGLFPHFLSAFSVL